VGVGADGTVGELVVVVESPTVVVVAPAVVLEVVVLDVVVLEVVMLEVVVLEGVEPELEVAGVAPDVDGAAPCSPPTCTVKWVVLHDFPLRATKAKVTVRARGPGSLEITTRAE
jgi:hypothetical protein